jgi:ribosomal protein S12 methylthiotransferase
VKICLGFIGTLILRRVIGDYQPMHSSKLFENISYSVVTLGCAKNTVETEFLEGSLREYGYTITDLEDAAIIIVNTCGFIEAAKEESIETILELTRYKKNHNCKALIVTGCLAQRYPQDLFNEIAEVDAIIELSHLRNLPSYISEILSGKRVCKVGLLPSSYNESRIRNLSGKPSAYLQISDGCNNFCTYCSIPIIRGRYRSRSLNSLLSEAKNLVTHGVKEIVLIGQDTSYYGSDIYGKPKLDILLNKLANLEELSWIRLLYCQPQYFSDELIDAIANDQKVTPYVDIPFQHASKKILKKMGRKGGSKEYLELIKKVRNRIPDVAIRTSLILGFPGESDKDFDELMRFVEEIKFDYIGLFEYSPEENTVAYDLPNHVPKELVRERFSAISDLKDAIAIHKGRSYLGRKVRTLVESIIEQKGRPNLLYYRGRTVYQGTGDRWRNTDKDSWNQVTHRGYS